MIIEKVIRQKYAKLNFLLLPKCYVHNESGNKYYFGFASAEFIINSSRVELLF